MKRSLATVMAVLALVVTSGCCTCKRVFGVTRYSVCVQNDSGTHTNGPTHLVLVWPREGLEINGDLDGILMKWRDDTISPEDAEVVDLGTFGPDTYDHFDSWGGKKLHRHCDATTVRVYSSFEIKSENGGTTMSYDIIPIDNRPGEPAYHGYLKIHVTDDGVKMTPLTSQQYHNHGNHAQREP